MVYVDAMTPCIRSKRWPWDKSCHLFADTDAELHLFAARMGLRRSWYQDDGRLHHFNLTAKRRAQAVEIGAQEVGREKVVELIRMNSRPVFHKRAAGNW